MLQSPAPPPGDSVPCPKKNDTADMAQAREKFLLKLWFKALKTKNKAHKKAEAAARKAKAVSGASLPAADPEDSKSSCAAHLSLSSSSEDFVVTKDVAAAQLRKVGVCCIEGAVATSVVNQCRKRMMEIFKILQPKVAALGVDGEVKCREITRRNPGRYDITYLMDAEPFRSLRWHASWRPVVKRLLGTTCRLLKVGCVVALPGAEQQGVHRDGRLLFDELQDPSMGPLPPHCLTVFVPLIDLRREHGPTEYWPGTHHETKQSPGAKDGHGEPIRFCAKAGAAIIHDYRLRHRGGANGSNDLRPLLYFTYARSWFHDATNYPTQSLFDDDEALDSDSSNPLDELE